jgi:hypothetical protein
LHLFVFWYIPPPCRRILHLLDYTEIKFKIYMKIRFQFDDHMEFESKQNVK